MKPENKLINLLKKNKVIPIVGAGVSFATAGLSGWSGLIKDGIEYANDRNLFEKSQLEKINRLVEKNKLIEAATILKKILAAPNFPYSNWLNDTFDGINIQSNELINEILNLSTSIIATTNYDTLLTSINNFSSRERYDHTQYQEIIKKISNNQDCVVHLHGIYTKPETVVLDEKDYKSLNENEGYKLLMKKLFLEYHLLFIGCSKDGVMDEDFKNIFNFYKKWFPQSSNQHFILVHENEIKSKNHIELLRECNVEAISYGNSHENLPTFLSQINPNKEKRAKLLKEYAKDLRESLEKLQLQGLNNPKINRKLDDKISKTFNSKYDWIDSEKMKIFEEIFTDLNVEISNKREKFIFTKNLIESLVKTNELKEKLDLWEKNRRNATALSNFSFINTALFAYQCLQKIPKDILNDIKLGNYTIIHHGFFNGHLGGFIREIQTSKENNIDIEKFYSNDDYMFENLKRIIDSLYRFLELTPDDLYQIVDKATIRKNLPDKFLTIIEGRSIFLKNPYKLDEFYARLPLQKNSQIIKAKTLIHNKEIYVLAYSRKSAFYWKPQEHITPILFCETINDYGINNLLVEIKNNNIYIYVQVFNKIKKYKNFKEIFEQTTKYVLNGNSIKTNFGYITYDRHASSYEKIFLKSLDNKFSIIFSLTLKDLLLLLSKNLEFHENLEKYKDERQLRGDKREPFLNVISNPKVERIFHLNKELYLLSVTVRTSQVQSSLLLFEVIKNQMVVLDIKLIKSGDSFSFDYYSNGNELLIFCGFLDLSRNDKVGALVSIKNNLFAYDKVITLPRESEMVRDIFEVQFINKNTVLLNEESLKIITLNIESGKDEIYHIKENNRITYIEYFDINE